MIQGAGIGCRVSFTHRYYRKARAAQRKKSKLLKHRNEFCKAKNITRAEYMKRLKLWRELRQIVTRLRAIEQGRDDQESVADWMKQKERQRVSNRARAAENSVKIRAAKTFDSFMMPIE